MSEKSGSKEVGVFQTNTFEKEFRKFSEEEQLEIDEQIERIIEDPAVGQKKKGDLSHLRVHKFILNNRQVLLGYSWSQRERRLNLYLLSIGAHENFYKKASKRRKSDLRIIGECSVQHASS